MTNQRTLNSKKSGVFEANLFTFITMFLWVCYDFILVPFQDKIPDLEIIDMLIYRILPKITFLLIPTIIYLKKTKKPFKKVLRLNKINFRTLVITIFIIFLYIPIGDFFSLLMLYIFPGSGATIENSLIDIPIWVEICVGALMPSIFEEFTMRGIALYGYNGISIGRTSMVIGFFFGLLHRNVNQFAYAFIMGIILAYLVRITNSIIPAILSHFLLNSSFTIISYCLPQENIKVNSEVVPSIDTIIFVLVLAVICSICIIFLIRKLTKINNYSDIKQVDEFKKSNNIEGKIKIVNWPFVGIVIMGIFSIGLQLVMLYVLK